MPIEETYLRAEEDEYSAKLRTEQKPSQLSFNHTRGEGEDPTAVGTPPSYYENADLLGSTTESQ